MQSFEGEEYRKEYIKRQNIEVHGNDEIETKSAKIFMLENLKISIFYYQMSHDTKSGHRETYDFSVDQ